MTPFDELHNTVSEAEIQAARVRGLQAIKTPPRPTPPHTAEADPHDSKLRRWWIDDAFDEADQTIAKMEEYGSGDLVALGHFICRISGRPELPPVQAMQLGCLMYLVGKMERAAEAIIQSRGVKQDTWFDIGVYAKMARAAQAGTWEMGR